MRLKVAPVVGLSRASWVSLDTTRRGGTARSLRSPPERYAR